MQHIDLDSAMHKPVERHTPAELLFRLQEIDTPEFVPYMTSWASTGIQSFVELGEVQGFKAIRKLSGTHLPIETLKEIYNTLPAYRQMLVDNKVSIPINYSTHVNGGLVIVDEFIEGPDLDVLAKIDSPELANAFRATIKLLCDANSGTNQSNLMFDAKMGNFVWKNGEIYFIDFFPPTIRGEDGEITPFYPDVYKRSKNLFNFNYGDTRGQITKLLASIKMTYPQSYNDLANLTFEVIKASNLPFETESYIVEQVINDFPDMTLFYKDPVAGEERLKELLK